MNEATTILERIGFRNGKTRTSDRFGDTEAFSETTGKGSLAGADVANKFNDDGLRRILLGDLLGEFLAEVDHLLL